MSPLHLIWILPLVFFLGFMLAGVLGANKADERCSACDQRPSQPYTLSMPAEEES